MSVVRINQFAGRILFAVALGLASVWYFGVHRHIPEAAGVLAFCFFSLIVHILLMWRVHDLHPATWNVVFENSDDPKAGKTWLAAKFGVTGQWRKLHDPVLSLLWLLHMTNHVVLVGGSLGWLLYAAALKLRS